MTESTPPVPKKHHRQTPLWAMYLCAVLLLVLDQWTKFWVVENLTLSVPVPVIEPFLYYRYVTNDGAAFSILRGQKWILSLIAGGVSCWILFYASRLKQRQPMHIFALAAILAGALGNLIDRLRLGYVVDFVDLHYKGGNIWPIFNVADICINLGVALLILYFLLYPEEEEATSDTESTSHTT